MNRIKFLNQRYLKITSFFIFFFITLVYPIDKTFGQAPPTIITEITSDIPIVVDCPCAEITVTVRNNNPSPENFMVKVIFPNDGFDPDNLPTYFSTIPNTVGDVTTSFIFFEPNETKTFVLKGSVTSSNTIVGQGRVSRPNGQFFVSGFSITPATFVDIDGTDPANPASLLDLINSGTLIDQSEACTFDQNPSPSFQSIYVRGTLEIDTDYCFKRNPGDGIEDGPFIMLDTDAKIIVKSGNELIIRRHVLGCINMWESIKVEEDARLIVSGSLIQDGKTAVHAEQGSVLDIYSSTFRDNYIGIKFEDDVVNLPPPYIQLNKFYDNKFLGTGSLKRPYSDIKRPYTGIELISTDVNFIGTPNAENHFSNMINGIIATSSSIKVKHARFYDIRANDVGNFAINGNGIHLEGTGNSDFSLLEIESSDGWVNGDPSFLNCDTGIKVIRGYALITGQKMIKVNTGIDISEVNNLESIDIFGCWIEPSDYGIKLFNIYDSWFNRINNNYIFMNSIGTDGVRGTAIRGGFVNKTEIMRSTIELWEGKHGIWFDFVNLGNIWENSILYPHNPDLNHDEFYGMRIDGGSANIRCNYIDGNVDLSFDGVGDINESLSDYNSSKGIYVNNSNVEVKCNFIQNNKIGIQAWGACLPSIFRGNDHAKDYNSLLLGNYDNNGSPDGNAWIGAQGGTVNNPSHHGNRWLTNNSNNDMPGNDIYGAVHLGTDDIIEESIFRVNSDLNAGGSIEFMPAFDTPNSSSVSWFEEQINTAFECVIAPANSDCYSGIGDPDLMFSSPNDSEIKIAQGQDLAVDGPFEKAVNWTMGRHLFKKLRANDDMINADTDMQSFVNTEENSSIGHFYNIEKGIRDAYDFDNDIIPQIESYRDQISAYHQAIYELDSLFNDDPTPAEYQLIATQKTDLLNSIYPIFVLNKNLLEQHSVERKSKIDLLKLENSNIQVNYIFEENEKLINDIYLSYFTPGSANITTEVLNQIKAVASQCPLSGGNAVFRARALLIPYDDKEYDDVALCQNSESKRIGGNPLETRLTVYPNPAYDQIFIEIPEKLLLVEELTLNLINTLGQIVRTEKISTSSLRIEMNVKGLPSGLYSCTLMKNDKPFIHKKVMVISR